VSLWQRRTKDQDEEAKVDDWLDGRKTMEVNTNTGWVNFTDLTIKKSGQR